MITIYEMRQLNLLVFDSLLESFFMKHAFLIMAHKNFDQLDELLRLLDHERIDIFLHVDKKSPKYVVPICSYSNIIQIPSIKTNWGGYSLVESELKLLDAALHNGENYNFIHLLSGQDLPIKPIGEILSFFDSHKKYNFIHFDLPEDSKKREERVRYYYPFLEYKQRGKRTIWSISQRLILEIQKFLNVDRTKGYKGQFKSGSQWWSIDSELARYILSERKLIRKLFKYTMSDEMFVQTLVYNSKYYETLYRKESDELIANQRLIDFDRGNPYIWTIKDIDEIKNSDLLFARKFDDSVDKEVIEDIIEFCNYSKQ